MSLIVRYKKGKTTLVDDFVIKLKLSFKVIIKIKLIKDKVPLNEYFIT